MVRARPHRAMTPLTRPRSFILLMAVLPCQSLQTAAPLLPQQSTGNSCQRASARQMPSMAVAADGERDALDMTQTWKPESYQKNAGFVAELGSPVLELLAAKPGERILDLGCGDGVLTHKLAQLGCKVVGIDASSAQIAAAREAGLEAYVMNGEDIHFDKNFDAVFSNAALHWMTNPDAVIAGVKRVLKPRGRFVAELGGLNNVLKIREAVESVLSERGIDAAGLSPWYFPSSEEYESRLTSAGFQIDSIQIVDRPTPLPGDVVGWLRTFGESYLSAVAEEEQEAVLSQVRDRLRPVSIGEDGVWYADYVRLRFAAHLPDPPH